MRFSEEKRALLFAAAVLHQRKTSGLLPLFAPSYVHAPPTPPRILEHIYEVLNH